MVRLASDTDATWKPIKGNTYPISFGSAGTVYGGTVDLVTGVLTGTHVMKPLRDFAWTYREAQKVFFVGVADMKRPGTLMSSHYAYSTASPTSIPNYSIWNQSYWLSPKNLIIRDDRFTDADSFRTNMGGVTIVYELETPQTYNLTAQQVELLTGNNNVWADTGDITLTYGADPYKLVNPTLFPSKPLLKVTGRGTLSVGDVTLTISGTTSQVLYIDCDIMEVYSITGGQMQPQNSLVTISGNEYPTLQPGATQITLGSGITQVVITPRWWRI